MTTYMLRTQFIVKWSPAAVAVAFKLNVVACRMHTVLAAVVFCFAAKSAIDGDMKAGTFAVLMGTLFTFDRQVLLMFTAAMDMINGSVDAHCCSPATGTARVVVVA